MKIFDLFIVGGGINGVGIARDAAGRGLRVGLCEKDDLASHTSSASTKLIHGGLRYLENGEFGLVRKSLREREVLLHAAPHIIWPLAFVLPHHRGLRPAWMLQAGLWIYDRLGGRNSLPRSRRVALDQPPFTGQLKPGYETGFCYHDCWVEDSRLVVLNAVDAAERGADIRTQTRLVGLDRTEHVWTVELETTDGCRETVQTRLLVNAAGPWAGRIQQRIAGRDDRPPVRLIQGSHIVVPRQYQGEHAWLFQNADGRVIFAIPYEKEFTLIGTTETPLEKPTNAPGISSVEIAYLCKAAGDYFSRPIRPDEVVWSYSGIRALFDDQAASSSRVTRDYVLELDEDGAPALSIYGGKITTYRQLAEDVLERLSRYHEGCGDAWTHSCPLPGGDFALAEHDDLLDALKQRYAFVDPATVARLFRAYGTRIHQVLDEASGPEQLGAHFGGGLYQVEIDHLLKSEWARTGDDILWRRSRLGLHLSPEQVRKVADYCDGYRERFSSHPNRSRQSGDPV